MNNRIFTLLGLITLSLISFQSQSQYLTGIGARLGTSNGLTVIRYFAPRARGAGDLIIAHEFNGWCGTLLYEEHFSNHNINIELANVGFFLGAGGHAGIFPVGGNENKQGKNFAGGVDFIAGAEWKLPHVPLLLSVDIKPYYDINVTQRDILDYCISLRYLF
jgi:hypothetical protein